MKVYIVSYNTNYGECVWVICAENRDKLDKIIKHHQNNYIQWGGYTHSIWQDCTTEEIDTAKEGVQFIGGCDV